LGISRVIDQSVSMALLRVDCSTDCTIAGKRCGATAHLEPASGQAAPGGEGLDEGWFEPPPAIFHHAGAASDRTAAGIDREDPPACRNT
jgi:hypothetical protein